MIERQQFLFAGILVAVTIALAVAMVLIPGLTGRLFRVQKPGGQKLEAYECGMTPVGSARTRFSIKFYLVAMLFILFDIEAIFLYPWVVVHRWLGLFGLIEIGIFLVILLAGYVYLLKRGAFRWE